MLACPFLILAIALAAFLGTSDLAKMAVLNGMGLVASLLVLAAYVVLRGQWQYWL